MSRDYLITADARKVSGLEFFREVFGYSPERRAQQDEQGRKSAARIREKHRQDILDMREAIARLLSPENAAKAREEWAAEDALREGKLGLVEVEHLEPRDGWNRRAA